MAFTEDELALEIAKADIEPCHLVDLEAFQSWCEYIGNVFKSPSCKVEDIYPNWVYYGSHHIDQMLLLQKVKECIGALGDPNGTLKQLNSCLEEIEQ